MSDIDVDSYLFLFFYRVSPFNATEKKNNFVFVYQPDAQNTTHCRLALHALKSVQGSLKVSLSEEDSPNHRSNSCAVPTGLF